MWGTRLREERENVRSCSGFLGGCHTVFEVIGYRVYSERAGFLQEFGRRRRDCDDILVLGFGGVSRLDTVEESSPENGSCGCGHVVELIEYISEK